MNEDIKQNLNETGDYHLPNYWHLLNEAIVNEDFLKALIYLDNLMASKKIDLKISNYYLFLLSLVTTLPSKYQERCQNFQITDLPKTNDLTLEEIKIHLLNKDFSKAIQKQGNLNLDNKFSKATYIVLKTISASLNPSYEVITSLIKRGAYKELTQYILSKSILRKKTSFEANVLELISILTNPHKKASNWLNIMKSTIKTNNGNSEELQIYSLLINAIYKLQPSNQDKVGNPITNEYLKLVEVFNDNDLTHLEPLLTKYLTMINGLQYKKIIMDLIMISVLNNKDCIKMPLTFLNGIQNNNDIFQLNHFIILFYDALYNNHFDTAKLYLDIIDSSKSFNLEAILVFPKLKELLDTKLNLMVLTKIQLKEIYGYFITNRWDELRQDGILLIDLSDKLLLQELKTVIGENPHLKTFRINKGKDERRVIRYYDKRNYSKEDINLFLKRGAYYYYQGNFEKCLQDYRKVLLTLNFPAPFIYEYIGFSYLGIGKQQLGLDYLKIAKYLYKKKENIEKDYTSQLAYIEKKDMKNEEVINYPIVSESEFTTSNLDNIPFLNDIINKLNSSSKNLEEICEEFNLQEEDTYQVFLALTQIYYENGYFEIGDTYLNYVEKQKIVNSQIRMQINELRNNRKFLKNRETSNTWALVLKPYKKKS